MSQVWRLQLAQRPPAQTPKVLDFIRKLEAGQIPLPAAKL